jgi:hypothetical protein
MARSPLTLTIALAATLLVNACGLVTGYRGEAIEGRVVDAATGEPLAAVIVVARWSLLGGLHPDDMGNLHLEETVSAEDGRYRFAAWGPRRAKFMTTLDPSAPMLYFFKPGYELRLLVNDQYEPAAQRSPRRSRWNGAIVELAPATEVDGRYFGLIQTPHDPCAWQQVPHLTATVLNLPDAEIRDSRPSLAALWLGEPTFEAIESLDGAPGRHKRCADPRAVLNERLRQLPGRQQQMADMLRQLAKEQAARNVTASPEKATPPRTDDETGLEQPAPAESGRR